MTRLPVSKVTTDQTQPGDSFNHQLTVLDEALLGADDSVRQILGAVRASAIRVRQELNEIQMSSLAMRTLAPAACFDCGRKNLDVYYTSKHGGYHLCETCFHRRHEHGRARHSGTSAEPVVE